MKYILTIMASTGEEKRFESATPFMAISEGDALNMTLFQDAEGFNLPLRVVTVEHAIWHDRENGELCHMVSLYTRRDMMD